MLKKFTLAAMLATALFSTACSSDAPAATWTKAQLQTQGLQTLQARAHGFAVGNPRGKTVYVLFDPQCPHCGELWEAAQPLLGKLNMIWVPIGVLSPVSTPQGAVLLASKDAQASMTAHEQSLRARTGGVFPGSAHAAQLDLVKANTQLFAEIGFQGVPVLLFSDAAGQTQAFEGGMDTAHLASLLHLNP